MKIKVLSLLIFLLPVTVFALDFSETQSDNFAVYSDTTSSESSLLAHDMEILFSQAMTFLGMNPELPLFKVYHFQDMAAFQKWLDSEWGFQAGEAYCLVERSVMSPPVLVIYGDWKQKEAEEQIRFLLMSQILKQLNPHIPSWLSLGLSTTFEGTAESEALPQPALKRWVSSRGEGYPWHSAAELLQVQQDFLQSLPELKGELWLFLSFLMEHPQEEQGELLVESLALLLSGEKGPWPNHTRISRTMEKDYQQYREEMIRHPEEWKELISAYEAQEYTKVLELCTSLKDRYPAEAGYFRALVEFKKGEWENSRSHFLEALEAGAPEAQVRSSLALCYWELDLIEMAREEIQKVAKLDDSLVPEALSHLLD